MAVRRTKVIVTTVSDGSGDVVPMGIAMPDGRCLPVERFLDVTKGSNLKIGVAGKRYRCVINHGVGEYRQHSLWREGDNWFVEEVVDDCDY